MINQERLKILEKMKEYESRGYFDTDLENDPPSTQLQPDQIEYLRKKWRNKIARFFVNIGAEKAMNNLIKSGQLIIKNVIGLKNLKDIKGSAFVTSNHFNPFENIAIYKVFQKHAPNKHGFYRIIREGNYTAPPKGLDKFFRHCNTLTLSSNVHTMRKFFDALEVITKKPNYMLVYPEQYMWWNYKKPRPFKDGAFKLACKYDVPIIPCFITMEDSKEFTDADGFPVQEYTVHIMKPIYRNKDLPTKEAVKEMKDKNFELCKQVYENTYKIPLKYDIKEDSK